MQVLHPPADLTLGPDGSADAVLTFRNFHNWMQDGIADGVVFPVVCGSAGPLFYDTWRAKGPRRLLSCTLVNR